ncbi:transposase [Paraphaeosphaeria sporulosa]
MPPQQRPPQSAKEARIDLAIASYRSNPRQSLRRLARSFDVPRSTLQTRLHNVMSKHAIRPPNRKLYPTEEQTLVDWILDLNQRGFPPHIIDVRRMADHLLAARGQIPAPQSVGKNWVLRFINTQPDLQTKWTRSFHSQRALCEDPVKISAWNKLVEETRQTYGIQDRDTYNFDETGFMMGVAASSKVVASADTVGRAIHVQPGNRDWVTTIETINASGWSLPPLIILSGSEHQTFDF